MEQNMLVNVQCNHGQRGCPSLGPRAPTWRPWTRPWGPDISSAVLEGPSWMAGKQTGGPSRGPRALTWRPSTRPWGPDTAIQTWWVVCWRNLQTSRPAARPTGPTRVAHAPWPSSTPCSVSGRLWTGNLPGCCGLLADGWEPTWSPCDRTTWAGVSSSALVCMIMCLPRSWCKPQSQHCRTSREPSGTSDEVGSFSPLMTACISRTLMCHDLWDADHCPCVEREPNWAPQPELDTSVKRVISVSLVAKGRPCRTAGDAHQAPLTAPTEELWSGWSSSQSPGTMLWQPTTGPEEDGVFPVVPVKP